MTVETADKPKRTLKKAVAKVTAPKVVRGEPGTYVNYVSREGKNKVALVIMSPDMNGSPRTKTLAEGERHLRVYSPTGNVYNVFNVKQDESGKKTTSWN